MVLRNSASSRNKQSKNEQFSVFKFVDSEHQHVSDVWVLTWPHKTKLWRWGKTMLHGYGHTHSPYKIGNICPHLDGYIKL